MNGVHDLGGMDNFGPIIREENEPVAMVSGRGLCFPIRWRFLEAAISA